MVNTIARGFIYGGNSNSFWRKYVRQVLTANIIPHSLSKAMHRGSASRIVFSSRDATSVFPRDNDPMIVMVQYNNWDIKRVLINPRSLAYILF